MYDKELAKELQKSLDAIIEDISDPEPYSKQQPHVSRTLSKYLSCIKIMKTQKSSCWLLTTTYQFDN